MTLHFQNQPELAHSAQNRVIWRQSTQLIVRRIMFNERCVTKIDEFRRRQVVVAEYNICGFQIAVRNVLRVEISDCLKQIEGNRSSLVLVKRTRLLHEMMEVNVCSLHRQIKVLFIDEGVNIFNENVRLLQIRHSVLIRSPRCRSGRAIQTDRGHSCGQGPSHRITIAFWCEDWRRHDDGDGLGI